MPPRSGSLPLNDPYPMAVPSGLSLINGTKQEQDEDEGVIKIEHEDGSVTIDFNPKPEADEADGKDDAFTANLAVRMEDGALSEIATTLLDGIARDDQSRKDWLETRARGITMLGLKIEPPRSDAGNSTTPLEGMSTVRHPALLEATVSFQATARAELLPASGPVKVRNDTPPRTDTFKDTNAAAELADSLEGKDVLAQALEKDMNHYLTSVATEYIPDTDRMFFHVGFGGDGIKKVYNCPLRQRVVSESVDAEDFIVSNAAVDIQSCGRVTHKTKMRKSVLRRMQILGAYRDVELNPPPPPQPNVVDKKKEELSGVKTDTNQLPEDRDYEIYESYCELDLDEFAPKQYKGKGLPLPYRVTIEKDSRQILDIRRNWDKDDEQCLAKQYFVQFSFIRGIGFYGLGFIHLLGNVTNALTAAYRLILDSGMFANFPGFLYSKGAGRQNTNQFRIPPGGGQGIDVGATQNIRDAILPLPYKEAGSAFTTFITHVEEVARRLSSTANIQVGEGKQEAPVGTTLALIEQASKVMDSVHKRLHAAQAEEFKLIKDRFREDPEAFWRHNRKPTVPWRKAQFIEALNSCDLVPVADPNNPTSLHRIAKAMTIKQLQKESPLLYDPIAVDMRVMRIVDIDPAGLFKAQPANPPPDPRMEAIKAKAQAEEMRNQISLLETKIKAATSQAQIADKAYDRQSREKVEEMKLEIARLKIQQEQIIHAHDANQDAMKTMHELQLEGQAKAQELHNERLSHQQELQADVISGHHDTMMERMKHEAQMKRDDEEHQRKKARDDEEHQRKKSRDDEAHAMKMAHDKEMHAAKLEAAKQLAKVKPKPSKGGDK